jgi:hypothetical protein
MVIRGKEFTTEGTTEQASHARSIAEPVARLALDARDWYLIYAAEARKYWADRPTRIGRTLQGRHSRIP